MPDKGKRPFGAIWLCCGCGGFFRWFLGERVPYFTALRVRVFTECLHAYTLDVFLEKSREHVYERLSVY